MLLAVTSHLSEVMWQEKMPYDIPHTSWSWLHMKVREGPLTLTPWGPVGNQAGVPGWGEHPSQLRTLPWGKEALEAGACSPEPRLPVVCPWCPRFPGTRGEFSAASPADVPGHPHTSLP